MSKGRREGYNTYTSVKQASTVGGEIIIQCARAPRHIIPIPLTQYSRPELQVAVNSAPRSQNCLEMRGWRGN